MSEVEPNKHRKKQIALRHIPQEVVPVAMDEVRDLVRDALTGTSILSPAARAFAGWAFFEPHVRFTPVDATHTRVELDVSGAGWAETLLFTQRRAEIDRFFVAIQDELDRRERWQSRPPIRGTAIEGSD